MSEDKKENSPITTFLVILSALGMLAIVILLGLAFFFPGFNFDNNSENPSLSSRENPILDNRPSINDPEMQSQSDNSTLPEESDSQEDIEESLPGQESPTDAEVPEVVLEDSEALIDQLMKNEDTSTGPLDIHFQEDVREPEITTAVHREETVRREETPAAPVVQQPRYEDVEKTVYWIQLASFPNSIKADELQSKLQQVGISSTIQTKRINSTLYYRVRVGAFDNENSADSFSAQILQLGIIDETTIYTSKVTQRVEVNR
ncbi:MAG: SPOR domain-containing protein [Spirochaetaceae bacterium]|jgi:cell division protein FtsN|nr:SPOR domain-containing protein [Spirochaetaceae bacterium]